MLVRCLVSSLVVSVYIDVLVVVRMMKVGSRIMFCERKVCLVDMNCGMKVMKKMMFLGFSVVIVYVDKKWWLVDFC